MVPETLAADSEGPPTIPPVLPVEACPAEVEIPMGAETSTAPETPAAVSEVRPTIHRLPPVCLVGVGIRIVGVINTILAKKGLVPSLIPVTTTSLKAPRAEVSHGILILSSTSI